MKVLFIQPAFPSEMPRFVRGLVEVGATVVGAGDQPESALPAELRRLLSGHVQLPSFSDEDACVETLVRSLGRVGIDRVESLWEPTVILAARVRERLGIPGMSAHTAVGFRDKQTMKERALAAGARVPRSRRVASPGEAMAAAEAIGFPLVIKPIAGAGTATTWRCDSRQELQGHLDEMGLGPRGRVTQASVEEFVEGEEHTYDALCLDGMPVLESVTRYHPPPLVARNEQWVSPAQITYRNPYVPPLLPGIALGRQVVAGLGMTTGMIHMEWFRTPSGEAILGEIACRPGGGKLMDMLNWAQDIDIFREWARAACWKSFEGVPQHAHHVAIVFKRARGEGRIRGIEGLQRLRAELGPHIVEEEILPIGAPRRDWKQTLLSDGWIAVRHPDYDTCHHMMNRVVHELQLFAG